MEKLRIYVQGRLGKNEEKNLYDQYGKNEDEFIHNFLLALFDKTNEAGMCKYCKQKTVYVHLKQDRSADEGMTAHAICNNSNCLRKWVLY